MGDYISHYVLDPDVPLADAMAASAAVPGLIGPLVVRSGRYAWHRYEAERLVPTATPAERYELWDGGVYDNLGLEPLFKPGGGVRDGVDLLVISDASAPQQLRPGSLNRMRWPAHRVLRLIDIACDQVRGLRSRAVVAQFAHKKATGVYFKMGNTVDDIYLGVGQSAPPTPQLGAEDVSRAGTFPTTLRRLTEKEFNGIHRHGFEVADATLATRLASKFLYRGFPG
jgi:NTE family protein